VKLHGGDDMAGDMTAIPSLTLQKLIDKARNSSNMNSSQLQETLQLAGIIDPQTGMKHYGLMLFCSDIECLLWMCQNSML
jgi:predicted HTH transcriptional regulator